MERFQPLIIPPSWRLPALIGLLVGLLMTAFAAALTVQERSLTLGALHAPTAAAEPTLAAVTAAPTALTQSSATLTAAPTRKTPSITPSVTPAVSPTPAPVDPAILELEDQFAQAKEKAEKESIRDGLLTLLSKQRDVQNRARIFVGLGEVETGLGHVHLACGYYEQAYALYKSPQYLLKLATAEMLADKYDHARMRYMELIDWPGRDADPYREDAQAGLDMVNGVLGAGG